MSNTGIAYELFVQHVQQALIDAQKLCDYQNVTIQHDVELVGTDGCKRQFDLYWEFSIGGYTYRNIIECKDYASSVPIGKIDELAGKLKTFPGIRGIIATRHAFQRGAVEKAKSEGIEVLVVRDEEASKDWVDSDGTPLIRAIVGDINCIVPPTLIDFKPQVDRGWAKAKGMTVFHFAGLTNQIFIDDKTTQIKRDLHRLMDYECQQGKFEEKSRKSIHRDLVDAYLECPEQPPVKIVGYDLELVTGYILRDRFEVRPEVLGVVEFILQKKKSIVMQNGKQIVIKDIPLTEG